MATKKDKASEQLLLCLPAPPSRTAETPMGFDVLKAIGEEAILENAVDSLRMGVRHYNGRKLRTRQKWAILACFHCIELLLKERLRRSHPLLIYRNIDQPVRANSQTIGLDEALTRFLNVGVDLSNEDTATLKELRSERNQIEHHRFEPSKTHEDVLAKALRFIHRFLRDQLNGRLEDHVSIRDFKLIHRLIHDYEERVQRAKSRIPPEYREDFPVIECPDCGEDTLVGNKQGLPYCEVCGHIVGVYCGHCRDFSSLDETDGRCVNCGK